MANDIVRGMGFAHMAIGAADFEKSLAFYEALGLKLYTQWGGIGHRIALLDIGDGGKVELFEKPGLEASGENAFIHFAFAVQDVEAAYLTALRAGAAALKPPAEMPLDSRPNRITLRVAFVKGPSGEELEFFKQIVNRFN